MTRGRIGLIADTHDDAVSWDEIHPRTVEAFGGVDLILHCGDLTTTGVLDRLAEIAPVVAVRSAADPPAEPPRLVDGPTPSRWVTSRSAWSTRSKARTLESCSAARSMSWSTGPPTGRRSTPTARSSWSTRGARRCRVR